MSVAASAASTAIGAKASVAIGSAASTAIGASVSGAIEPGHYLWWLVSRASGIVALGLVSLAVLMGLAMSTKLLARPRWRKASLRLHEHLALISLIAISVHGLSLLGDRWLHPGIAGIAIPFSMSYRPLFTGLGIVAGYLAALLGLSFYLRRRIGARLWRRLHRATALVWVLGVAHTLGAGSDASTGWLRIFLLLTGVPIVYLLALRMLRGIAGRRGAQDSPHERQSTPHRERTERWPIYQ